MDAAHQHLPRGCKVKTALDSGRRADRAAFTLVELLTVLAVVAFCAVMVLPAMARTKTNSGVTQCLNNLKRLASAWAMYSPENGGSLAPAYPSFGGFQSSWCQGNAATGGGAGSYTWGGAEERGITNGVLWRYVNSMSSYKCPFDKRLASPGNPSAGKPILRTVSMNCYMAGQSMGTATSFNIFSGGTQDPNAPVYIKENEIPRPSKIFVFIDEDPQSVNDGMLFVDMNGSRRLIDLPSRLHGFSISFADTHVELRQLRDQASLNWAFTQPQPLGGLNDWYSLTNIATAPVN